MRGPQRFTVTLDHDVPRRFMLDHDRPQWVTLDHDGSRCGGIVCIAVDPLWDTKGNNSEQNRTRACYARMNNCTPSREAPPASAATLLENAFLLPMFMLELEERPPKKTTAAGTAGDALCAGDGTGRDGECNNLGLLCLEI